MFKLLTHFNQANWPTYFVLSCLSLVFILLFSYRIFQYPDDKKFKKMQKERAKKLREYYSKMNAAGCDQFGNEY